MIRTHQWACMALCLLLMPTVTAASDLSAALAGADIAKGKKIFRKCKSCHTNELNGKNKAGPNLYNIVGGEVAASQGYKYSAALIEYGGAWTAERLDAFLSKPKKEVKKTKMSFAGLKKPTDRADLILYLNSFSETPLIFDVAVNNPQTTSEETPLEFGVLKLAPGVETTFYACTACHSERIIAQQGLNRDHWDEVLEWMVEEQGMSEIDEPERSEILDYLAAHYNEDRPNFPVPVN